MKQLIFGSILALSLSGCATTRTPSTATGDVAYFMGRWDSTQSLHANEKAPQWTKEEYAELLKALNVAQADVKEAKVK